MAQNSIGDSSMDGVLGIHQNNNEGMQKIGSILD